MNSDVPSNETSQPSIILCVDDELNILKALWRLFHSKKYKVLLASSGAKGLELLAKEPIDLIISDMRMPEMDGAEFLSRAFQQNPNTIRIMLTGYADLQSTIVAVNSGRIFSYCTKPWDDEELKILVKNALEQKRLREDHERLTRLIHQKNKQLKALNESLEVKVEQRTQELSNTLQKLDHANSTLKKQYTESVKAFSRIIEMRPGIKSGHSKFIAEHAQYVGQKMLLGDEAIRDLVYAGLLLQIGKMTLPEELLTKPFHNLTSQQKLNYQQHANEAVYLLKGLSQLEGAVILIQHQYEHFNGSGTPGRLIAKKIPLGSRILAVVRDYIRCLEGSMTGQVMPASKAREHLQNFCIKIYDPEVVEVFLDYLDKSAAVNNRPVIEIPLMKLRAGMEIEDISYEGRIYLKNCIIDENKLKNVLSLWTKGGVSPLIRIRLGQDAVAP